MKYFVHSLFLLNQRKLSCEILCRYKRGRRASYIPTICYISEGNSKAPHCMHSFKEIGHYSGNFGTQELLLPYIVAVEKK